MSKKEFPFEGKIVVLRYKQVDPDFESSAVFVYRVVNNRLESILGVLNLPLDSEADWDEDEQKDKALQVIQDLGVREVFTAWLSLGEFFGTELGYKPLTDEMKEDPRDGAHVCWCEHVGLDHEFREVLKRHQVSVREINTETMQLVPWDTGASL